MKQIVRINDIGRIHPGTIIVMVNNIPVNSDKWTSYTIELVISNNMFADQVKGTSSGFNSTSKRTIATFLEMYLYVQITDRGMEPRMTASEIQVSIDQQDIIDNFIFIMDTPAELLDFLGFYHVICRQEYIRTILDLRKSILSSQKLEDKK